MATPHQRFARPVRRSCVGCQPGLDACGVRACASRLNELSDAGGGGNTAWCNASLPTRLERPRLSALLVSRPPVWWWFRCHHRCHSQHWEQSGAVEFVGRRIPIGPSNAQDGEPGTVGPVAEFRSSLVSSSRAAPARELRLSRPPIRYSRPPYLSCPAFPGAIRS